MIGAVIAVAHVAQTDRAGHVLEFTIAVRRAGETVERMVGDIKLHHAAAEGFQTRRLRVHRDARGDGHRAGGWRAVAPVDLDKAETAGTEGFHVVAGAELGDFGPDLHRRAHDRSALRHGDRLAVYGQRYHFVRFRLGRAVIDFLDEAHGRAPHSAAAAKDFLRKSSGK